MTLPRHPGDLEILEEEECRRLLASAPFARLGFTTAGGPTILPVNHLVVDGDVYFRTETGSKLANAAAEGPVAVEVDDGDLAQHLGWSVVGHGHASIVTDDDLVERLMSFDLVPWAVPDTLAFWVRIRLHEIGGRRIVAA